MKIILLAVTMAVSFHTQSQVHYDCMNEAVEVTLAYKVSTIAAGDCSNITRDQFMSIAEDRENKKRFLNSALKGLDAGEKIPSRIFDSFERTGEDTDLGKNEICPIVKKRSEFAAKELMKDCPEGAEAFQYLLGKQTANEKVSDVVLSEVCHKVEKLKKEACELVKTKAVSSEKEPSQKALIKKLPGAESANSSTAVAQ